MKSMYNKTLPVITNKYDLVQKKHIYELVGRPKKQPNRIFLRNDFALKVKMDCRTDESCNLKRNLGFRLHDVINTEKQTVLKSIKDAFEGEVVQTQYSVLGCRIDLYFHTNLQLKLMSQDMLTEILVMKLKDKKHQKKNLIRCLLELILMKKTLIFSKQYIKYTNYKIK